MNLIEQLAGYGECERLRAVPAASSFRIRGIEFTREELERAILEHRRAHNIFEVGDWIVKASRLNGDKVYRVFEVADSLNWVKTSCGAFIDAPMFRHATDEEIKAGRRL